MSDSRATLDRLGAVPNTAHPPPRSACYEAVLLMLWPIVAQDSEKLDVWSDLFRVHVLLQFRSRIKFPWIFVPLLLGARDP